MFIKFRVVTSCIGASAESRVFGSIGGGSGLPECPSGEYSGYTGSVVLEDSFQDLRHVFDGFEYRFADVHRGLGLQGKSDGIARAGIDLNNLATQLVLHAEDYAGKESAVLLIVHDDMLDLRSEAKEHALDEIVGQRPRLANSVESHRNSIAYRRVDVDDKRLVIVAQKYGAAV